MVRTIGESRDFVPEKNLNHRCGFRVASCGFAYPGLSKSPSVFVHLSHNSETRHSFAFQLASARFTPPAAVAAAPSRRGPGSARINYARSQTDHRPQLTTPIHLVILFFILQRKSGNRSVSPRSGFRVAACGGSSEGGVGQGACVRMLAFAARAPCSDPSRSDRRTPRFRAFRGELFFCASTLQLATRNPKPVTRNP